MILNKTHLKHIPKSISTAEIRSKALGYQDCVIVSHQPIPFYVHIYRGLIGNATIQVWWMSYPAVEH